MHPDPTRPHGSSSATATATATAPAAPSAVSGWLAGGASAWLLAQAAGRVADAATTLPASAAAQLAAMLLGLASLACGGAGLWLTASRRAAARGSRAVRLARVAALGVVGALLALVAQRHLAGQALEMARIAVGRDPLPPVRLALADQGRVLWLHGPMGTGSARKLRRMLDEMPDVGQVRLDSPGGRVFEAEAMAGEVRRRGLDTYAQGLCASACTMVLLAGRDRGAADGARIGFHRPQFAGIDDERAGDSHALLAAYRSAGLGSAFLARVRATRSDTMWYPSRGELQRWRVLTR